MQQSHCHFVRVCSCVTLPSQVHRPEHNWKLPSSMTTTSPSCLSMRLRSLRMRTTKASRVSFCQDTICSRHFSRCLFLSHKTRSVKTHFTMLVSVSHPMSTSPVTEYVAPAPANTLAARSPAIEHVAPASVVTYTALSSVIEYVASAPVLQ